MKKYSTVLFILISLTLAAILQPRGVAFAGFEISSAFKVLTILFLIALFQERALDVFLTIIRGPESDQKKQKIQSLLQQTKPAAMAELQEIQQQLNSYKIKTRNLAMYLGYALGFIISMIGIRALEPLVDSGTFSNLAVAQQNFFRVVDILITAGLLAGGSDGIHKITEVLRDFRLKAKES